jgi:hypothetical protein
MYDNQNLTPETDDVTMPEPKEEAMVAPAKKKKNYSEREWFILNTETSEIWKDQLYSEKECRNLIRVDGEYDIEYRIGYKVVALNTVTKTSRIVLK